MSRSRWAAISTGQPSRQALHWPPAPLHAELRRHSTGWLRARRRARGLLLQRRARALAGTAGLAGAGRSGGLVLPQPLLQPRILLPQLHHLRSGRGYKKRLFISCLTYACSQQTFSQTHRRCTQCTSLPAAAAAMHLKPHYSRREPHSSRTRTPLKPPYSRTSARRRSVSSRGGRRWCRSARNALSAPCLPRSASPTAATWEDGSGQG